MVQHIQSQILNKYIGKNGFTVTEFCRELGVSRQGFYNWTHGAEMSLKWLLEMAVDQFGEWQGDMAVELIRALDGRFVPCICQTEIGDRGICPRHGAAEHKEEQ